MKKKIFTLLTLLLCVCSGAWADATWTVDYTGKSSGWITLNQATGETDFTGSEDLEVENYGNVTLSYNAGTNSSKLSFETGDLKFGGAAARLTITLPEGKTFKAGDKLQIIGKGSGSSSPACLYVEDGDLLKSDIIAKNQSTAFDNEVTISDGFTERQSIVFRIAGGSEKPDGVTTCGGSIKLQKVIYTESVDDGKTTLTGSWSSAAPSFTVGATATIPTFTVTGGSAVQDTHYSVAYSLVSGSLATVNALTGITAINTEAAGTATVRATVTVIDTENYKIATTTYDCVITVALECAVPTYSVGPYNYDEGGYEVTFSCATDGATLEYVLTTDNPDDGTQSTYFDGTEQTYTGPIYTYGKRIIIKASKDGYTSSYSAKGSRYQTSAQPTGTSPEVVGWNVRGNSNGETNAAHGNRAVSLVGGHFAGTGNNMPSGTSNHFKMRVGPNLLNPIVTGVNKCMQMEVTPGYKVTEVKFDVIRANTDYSIPVSNVYVDGVALSSTYSAIPASSSDATTDYTIDLTSAAKGGATESIVIAFGETSATQYNAIITTTYTNTESVTTALATGNRTYATHIAASDLDFSTVSDEVTAYIATGLNAAGTAVVIEAVEQVPASSPILIKTATEGATVNVPLATSTPDALTTNLFVEGDGTTTINTATDTDTYYYLANNQFHKATEGTLQTGKAYLKLEGVAPTAARALVMGFDDENGEITGIQSVNSEVKGLLDGEFYNIAGQRVAMPKKGLYIVNGKKIIIK